ncbi:MAG: Crp/Fnr family transcriptional regulator [Halomonas sp.]|nr:Crp/Fnr family transcriptional regulator [Halomonas sp.]
MAQVDFTEHWIFKRISRYGNLTRKEEALLSELVSNPRRVDAGEIIWHEDAAADQFCILKQGWAYSFRSLDNGARQILKIYLPGDVIGMRDFGFAQRLAGVVMIVDGVICPFSYPQMFEVFRSSPTLATGLCAIAVRQQAMLTERLINLGRRTAQERVAHFLYETFLRLQRIDAVDNGRFHLPLSQEQLGDALGLSTVHVSRTFSMLRDEGLAIRDRYDVEVLDPDGLAALAQYDDRYLEEALPAPLFGVG